MDGCIQYPESCTSTRMAAASPTTLYGTRLSLQICPSKLSCGAQAVCGGVGDQPFEGRGGGGAKAGLRLKKGVHPPPLCDIPSGCCFFTGPWTVSRCSLHMLRRVAAFCRPLRPVLLLVSFPRSRSPVVGVLGLCWMWRDVPFACQRRPVVGVLGVVLVAAGVV